MAESMSLRAALDKLSKYTAKTGDAANQAVVADDGLLWASDGIIGCEIQCPDVDGLKFAVDCDHFKKQVARIDAPTLKVSGSRVTVTGTNGRFTIQTLADDKRPTRPKIPKTGWRTLTPDVASALALLAPLVADTKQGAYALTGIRLTPTWAAAANPHRGGVVWATDVVDTPIVVHPAMLEGAAGETEVAANKRFFFAHSESDARWGRLLEGEWTDGFPNLVAEARSGTPIQMQATDLHGILCMAEVEADSGLAAIRMVVSSTKIALQGGPQEGTSDVEAYVEVEGGPTDPAEIGVSPSNLRKIVEAAIGAPNADGLIQFVTGSASSPIIVQTRNAPLFEGLAMPMYLPA